MKSIKIILGSLLLLNSCSKNDTTITETVPVTENILLLKKTIDTDDNLTDTYSYDTSKKLINFSRNGNINNPAKNQNFSYNTDGILAQITNASDGSLVLKYFYDSNKKIIKKEGRNGLDIYNYEYTGNQVVERYLFTTTGEGFNTFYKYDSSGNVIETIQYTNVTAANPNGTLSATVIYTYDSKKNALTSLPKEYLFPRSNKNNLLTEKYNANPVYNYNWEYNDKGFPIKRTTSYVRNFEYQ